MDNDLSKQSKSAGKSTGSKDAKSIKNNKNRTLEAPDMPDMQKEHDLERSIKRRKSTPHLHASQKIREKVIELSGQGLTLTDISKIKGMPHARTIWGWKKEDPDFAEEMEEAFSEFVDQMAREALPKLRQALDLRGLRDGLLDEAEKLVPKTIRNADGVEVKAGPQDAAWREGLNRKLLFSIQQGEKKARALASTAGVILSYAERRSQLWRRDAEATSNLVVIDMSLEMDVKTDLPGSANGQNAAALKSMRNVTPK